MVDKKQLWKLKLPGYKVSQINQEDTSDPDILLQVEVHCPLIGDAMDQNYDVYYSVKPAK